MQVLISPINNPNLNAIYEKAFKEATELYLATAFLTNWSWKSKVQLNGRCKKFLAVIGTSFGLTRKKACSDFLNWLPSKPNMHLKAYPAKPGRTFHPKMLAWKEADGKCWLLVGSSNLTSGAMNENVEMNTFSEIKEMQYNAIVRWITNCSSESQPITKQWVENYKEADLKNYKSVNIEEEQEEVFDFKIPNPDDYKDVLEYRRCQCKHFAEQKEYILNLLEDCSSGKMTNEKFWESFCDIWNNRSDDNNRFRFQGSGVERSCTSSNNWSEITTVLLDIINNHSNDSIDDMDAFVSKSIDSLKESGNRARGAWFSEMLCQFFPERYPVYNEPVDEWIRDVGWKPTPGLSEGQTYIELAVRMRDVVRQNSSFVNNIAEIDHVIWKICHDKKELTQSIADA